MVFWKFFLSLVSTRSIELGLIGFLKQVGPTTRLYKLYVSQNDFIAASSTSQLKSPKIIKFSNLPMCVSIIGASRFKNESIFDSVWLYLPKSSYLDFLKLISRVPPSKSLVDV